MGTTTTPDYQTGLTFEQVWAMFQESREEADRRMKETDRQMKETDRKFQESREEFDRRSQEADRRMKKLEEQVEKTNKSVGGLNNSFGELAEHLVAPGVVERFNEMGFHFDVIAERGLKLFDKKGKIKAEIDILLENSSCVIVVEVKSSPKAGGENCDIEHHKKRLEILREHRPQDKRKILGAIAGAVFNKGVKEEILAAGFYVLEQTGDTMRIDIPEGFEPREW